VRLVLLSIQIPGNGLTLARLISINHQGDFTVFLVCDSTAEVPQRARYALERLGVVLLERPRLDTDALVHLFDDHLISRLGIGPPSELPSPEEIRQRLENDIRHMVSLPVLPQVHQQIVALDRDPTSDIQAWIKAIELDPLSRAQVIRRARSPVYGFRGEITEADKAIILLGKTATKDLIVSGALRRSVEGVKDQDFSVDDYWVHGVAVAVMARILQFPLDESRWTPDQRKDFDSFGLSAEALECLRRLRLHERLVLGPQQDPFLGGMMHDIGKVALVEGYPGLHSMIQGVMVVGRWSVPMAVAEASVAGGANHTLVGRLLAESWKLGDDVCRVVENHHAPSAEDRFSQLIALANLLGNGIYPFPKQATYPIARLVQGGMASLPGAAPPAEAPDAFGEMAPEDDPLKAVRRFLPAGLLEQLGLGLQDLIDLGKTLGPVVQRLTEEIRKSV
jgi:HD-like signal output (HDOD) protein